MLWPSNNRYAATWKKSSQYNLSRSTQRRPMRPIVKQVAAAVRTQMLAWTRVSALTFTRERTTFEPKVLIAKYQSRRPFARDARDCRSVGSFNQSTVLVIRSRFREKCPRRTIDVYHSIVIHVVCYRKPTGPRTQLMPIQQTYGVSRWRRQLRRFISRWWTRRTNWTACTTWESHQYEKEVGGGDIGQTLDSFMYDIRSFDDIIQPRYRVVNGYQSEWRAFFLAKAMQFSFGK